MELPNLQVTNSTYILLALATLTILVSVISYLTGNRKCYPPGPPTLPLIGNLHQLIRSKSMEKFCEKYRRIYGNVFTIELGGSKRVVISGYQAMHELLVQHSDCTSTRSTKSLTQTVQDDSKANPGIVWAPYPQWKNIRMFASNGLKEDGMGKSSMEHQILEEIDHYIQCFIQPTLSKPISMHQTLPQATANIVSQFIFGRRFDYSDERFNRMISALNESMGLIAKVTVFRNVPFISCLMKSVIAREQHLKREVMIPTIREYIDEHKRSLDQSNPRDLTDRLLLASGIKEGFTESNIAFISFHLYTAGAETSATVLRWAFLFMCKHQEIQRQVQAEIDQHIGRDRSPSYKDHLRMPYTDAVLLETLRFANVVVTSLPHYTSADIAINGTFVPADTDIVLNMASVLHDEKVFEEPTKFKPERYLTGDIALKKQRTIPFGIGKRVCLGESLAKAEIFLFFVTLLQRYDLRLPEDSRATTEPVTTLLNMPQNYDIIPTGRS